MTLSEWMKANSIDDAGLAAKVSTDRSTISRLRRGKQWPSRDLAARLFAIVGPDVSLSDLAGASSDPEAA